MNPVLAILIMDIPIIKAGRVFFMKKRLNDGG